MDQSSIVRFPHLQLFSAKDIRAELVQVLVSNAVADLILTKYRRNDIILQNEPEPEADDRAEDQSFSSPANVILEALEMMPFTSLRQIAKMAFILPTAVFRRLTKSFHFILKRFYRVAHRLSNLQKQARIIM
jgi:hypothetical protein